MLTMHQRTRLQRQDFPDTVPVAYPEDFSHDLGRDRDDLDPFRGILFALAIVLGALAWVLS